MEKIKNIVGDIFKNDYIRIIIELVIFVCLFGINNIVGCVFFLIPAIDMILTKKNENLMFVFLFLSFFDEILTLDFLKGSISRLVLIIVFIKLIYTIFKNKIYPGKAQIIAIVFLFTSFLVGIFSVGFNIESLIVIANVLVFVLFSMVLKFDSKEQVNSFIEKVCFICVIAVLSSIMYGFITVNFLKETTDNVVVYRFKGTYEPNFMCMYINLGLLSLITLKGKFKHKFIYCLLFAFMFNSALLTVSMTGLISIIISLILYVLINVKKIKKNIKKEIGCLVTIVLISLIIFEINKYVVPLIQEDVENSVQENVQTDMENSVQENVQADMFEYKTEELEDNETTQLDMSASVTESNTQEYVKEESQLTRRLEFLTELFKNRKFDKITSGRLPLMRTFIKASFDRPLTNILLGYDLSNKQLYCDFFGNVNYAHNSYLDCLYNNGIIGFFIVMYYIVYVIFKDKFWGFCLKNTKYCTQIRVIRIMLLIYALALSLYTKRMVLLFFI